MRCLRGLHAEVCLRLCRRAAHPRCRRDLGSGTGTPATCAGLVSQEPLFFLVREAENYDAWEEPSCPSLCVKWCFLVQTRRKERDQKGGVGLCKAGVAGTVAGTVTVTGHRSFLGTSILLCRAVVALGGMVRLLKQF